MIIGMTVSDFWDLGALGSLPRCSCLAAKQLATTPFSSTSLGIGEYGLMKGSGSLEISKESRMHIRGLKDLNRICASPLALYDFLHL